MNQPKIAQKAPYAVEVQAGRKYFWCSCGLSARQPLCDGSHKGSSFSPLAWEATEDTTIWFCGCKATHGQPLCDGTHNSL
ncbi:MAG: CDGSH iron-sulfur domain-containing protein [Alphaproteobacteria bacterium]